jgi:hypothetical protein
MNALFGVQAQCYVAAQMGTRISDRTDNPARYRLSSFVKTMSVVLAVTSTACAATPVKRPSEPLIKGEPTWPEEVMRAAERADRVCRAREDRLHADYQEGKEEKEKFKTVLGSITGAVGTAGGVITGVGAYVISSPDTAKTVTGVTGFVSGGLAAVGSVVTLVLSPGEGKMKSASEALAAIDEKRAAAHAALDGKDPSAWSDTEKAAWAKAVKELETQCK